MFDNIPNELKQLIQWCVWRFEEIEGAEKPTKVPYNPKTGAKASATNRQTWCSFDEACAAARSDWNYNGIGFFFSANDPYCGIDLDYSTDPAIALRQQQIFEKFNSYAERSPSGKGLHIIIKANVPHGRKRDYVEIYSNARYFTMTGDVYRKSSINDCNELANILWQEMAPPPAADNGFYGDPVQHEEDNTIYDKAAAASNGDKFVALYQGNWQEYYKSQSEADFALIDIIAYYTQNQPQIARMFRNSALGKRQKANRDNYLYPMIQRSFDNQLPPIDFSGLADRIEAARAAAHTPTATAKAASGPIAAGGAVTAPHKARRKLTTSGASLFTENYFLDNQPPGILRMITDYVYRSSPRPVYEISLTAALGLFSGIVGRQYNVSGTGLNQYLMLIADTGKGKEAMAAGIGRLVSALSEKFPIANEFRGPAEMASGQALLKYLAGRNTPCFVSLTGEFGIRLQQITDANASSAEKTLKKVMLDLYSKSGAGQSIEPSIYADKANNTTPIHSPAFTLLGESVAETFYNALDEESVAQGLLPRFTIIEYNGKRPAYNKEHTAAVIPEQLIAALEELALQIHKLADTGTVININVNPDAMQYLDQINDFSDSQINDASKEVLRQLWNRVHLKVFKLAGLLAVAHNYRDPIIDFQMVEWAASIIITDTIRLIRKFNLGEMGGENQEETQLQRMRSIIRDYVQRPFADIPNYGANRQDMHSQGVIPHSYIARAVGNNAAFRKDKRGRTNAINITIKYLVDNGSLGIIPENQLGKNFQYAGKAYAIIDAKWFLEG